MASTVDRRIKLLRLAKSFADNCREHSGFAFRVPDDTIDWLRDDEIELFKQKLRSHHLFEREDGRWESMR